MRHAALAAAATLAVAIVLVIVVGEEEATEDAPPAQVTDTGGRSPTTGTAPSSSKERTGKRAADVREIEEAVIGYIEAVELGTVAFPGLPTTDELSIQQVSIFGRERRIATAFLAGGAEVELAKRDGRWRVVNARPASSPKPTPPSNGP